MNLIYQGIAVLQYTSLASIVYANVQDMFSLFPEMRPNNRVFFFSLNLFSRYLRVHDWIQTTVSQLAVVDVAGRDSCRFLLM